MSDETALERMIRDRDAELRRAKRALAHEDREGMDVGEAAEHLVWQYHEACESEQVLLETVRRDNELMAHDKTIVRRATELLAAMDHVCGLAWRDSLARKDDEVDTAWIRLIDAVETSRPARDIRGAS